MTDIDERKLRKQSRTLDRTPPQQRAALKRKVRMFYDLQRLKNQAAGRTHHKAGVDIDLHEVDQTILGIRSKELEQAEKNALKDVEDQLKSMSFYRDVLSDKKRFLGLGPTMSGVILSEFQIERLETPSQLWSFAGLAPIPTKRCNGCHASVKRKSEDPGSIEYAKFVHEFTPKRKKPEDGEEEEEKKPKCKIIPGVYESAKAMRPTKGEKLKYNAFLKTKMVGVMADCLLKANSPWRKFYDDYKHRKESAGWGMSKGHRHRAALRYMVKQLLLEVWTEWRKHEGLSVRAPYAEEYLGKVHHG